MKQLILALTILTLTSCATQTFFLNNRSSITPTREVTQHFFLWGVGQYKSVDASKICGGVNRVAKVEARRSPVNVLMKVITLGIYTPATANVYCRM